jgi:prolyl-tRNA editing enzyme YbaK/EbsC (Cys-tRNA(Pro) deacylase)
MESKLNTAAQKVQDALREVGVECVVREMPASTRTAQDAAQAIGCQVGQIVKSLVFLGKDSRKPYLLLVSGANRVDEKKIAPLLGEAIEKADADFVRQQTGFAIGGVPPLAHTQPLDTLIDEDLMVFDEIWAAAGTPNAVFRLTPAELSRISRGKVACVKP